MSAPRPTEGIAVDASCFDFSGSIKKDGYFHGKIEWQGRDIKTGWVCLRSGIYPQGTINIAEFLAIVDMVKQLREDGDTKPVYSDSLYAINWYYEREARTKLPFNEHTRDLHLALDEAVAWLNKVKPENEVLFWSSKEWGENPADFGRKSAWTKPPRSGPLSA